MKRFLLVLVLALAPVMAQTQVDPNERIQKLVTLKYADPMAIQNLIYSIFGAEMRADNKMHVIALSGARSKVLAAEEAIKQLDVPSAAVKDIELTVYFVIGTDQAGSSGSIGGPIPQDLQSTVATLKSTFPFKNYFLLDVLALRTRSGVGASTSGQLGSRFTDFRVRSAIVEGDGTMIRLDGLHAGLRNPVTSEGKVSYVDTGVSTEVVDVKEGQKLVIGRTTVDSSEKALFLILTAKVN